MAAHRERLIANHMESSNQTLRDYIAYCPSCGYMLVFGVIGYHGDTRCFRGQCIQCRRIWSMLFDLDPSGTFGVQGFQCDNVDRIMEES